MSDPRVIKVRIGGGGGPAGGIVNPKQSPGRTYKVVVNTISGTITAVAGIQDDAGNVMLDDAGNNIIPDGGQ